MPLADHDKTNITTANMWALDIERFPRQVYEWSARHGKYTPEHMVISEARMCSFAAQRVGGEMVYSDEHQHGYDNMIRAVWTVMDQADILITFNGNRFDIPHIRSACIDLGLPPWRPFKSIDLCAAAKRAGAWEYNNLKSLAKRFGLEQQKQDNDGFVLWQKCMDGDDQAWAEFARYCKQDVRTTIALYWRLLPHIPSHPNMGMFSPNPDVCSFCGRAELVQIDDVYAITNRYPAFRCRNCGGVDRSNHRRQGVTRRPAR